MVCGGLAGHRWNIGSGEPAEAGPSGFRLGATTTDHDDTHRVTHCRNTTARTPPGFPVDGARSAPAGGSRRGTATGTDTVRAHVHHSSRLVRAGPIGHGLEKPGRCSDDDRFGIRFREGVLRGRRHVDAGRSGDHGAPRGRPPDRRCSRSPGGRMDVLRRGTTADDQLFGPVHFEISGNPAVRLTALVSDIPPTDECDPPAARLDVVATTGLATAEVAVFVVRADRGVAGQLDDSSIDDLVASLRRS